MKQHLLVVIVSVVLCQQRQLDTSRQLQLVLRLVRRRLAAPQLHRLVDTVEEDTAHTDAEADPAQTAELLLIDHNGDRERDYLLRGGGGQPGAARRGMAANLITPSWRHCYFNTLCALSTLASIGFR